MSSSFADPEFIFLDVALATEQVGGAEALQGMLSMLEESLARDIPKISQLLADGDVPSAQRVLHGLKGFIPIFCAETLCKRVTRVEELSKKGSVEDVAPAFAQLRPDLELLQAEVVDYLNGPQA